jgi:hypothetical protein
LCGDLLVQAVGQRVERAVQPLIKVHQGAISIRPRKPETTKINYTAPTPIGTVI